MARSFTDRLRSCVERADMTISDAAVWFDRPRPTVRTWIEEGRTPAGPSGRLAFQRLDMLQSALHDRSRLPIPADLSWRKRAEYIRGVRDAAERNARVPKMRTAS